MKVQFNQKQENPFYGMSNTLRMYQNGSKGMSASLDSAYKEARTKEQKELFWSLLFSFGDVANRQHTLFEVKVDNGGHAQREYFRDQVLPWAWNKVQADGLDSHRFLELVVEYTTLDNLVAARVVTKKKTKQVTKVINMIEVFGIENIVPVLVQMFHGSQFDQYRVARFLVGYTFNRRENMLKETIANMESRKRLLSAFVEASGLGTVDAYKAWKRNFTMESNLFSTGKILDYEREEFIKLIESMPGNARFRVKTKMYNEKWAKLSEWFDQWENHKEKAQAEQRVLEEKVKTGKADETDLVRLATVKKQAKVNASAKSFEEAFNSIVHHKFDRVAIQGMLDKVSLDYNTLIFADVSGSMQSNWGGMPYQPIEFAAFMATICLMKNPDAEASNLLGMFAYGTEIVTGGTTGKTRKNALLNGRTKELKGALVDRTASFETNFRKIRSILAARSGGSTNVASIFEYVAAWAKQDPSAVDMLSMYPVWTLISDGEFNNKASVLQSIQVGQRKLEQIIGFAPFVLLIDVAKNSSADIRQFEGASDIMMIPPQPGAIEQVLMNFRDLDVRDVFTPLLGIYRSDRYAPVRDWVSN